MADYGRWLDPCLDLHKGLSPTPVASPAPPVGRYQMMSDPKSGYVFLLDSATGKTWKYWGGEWSDGNSPVPLDGS
jgi:hypothetical protein